MRRRKATCLFYMGPSVFHFLDKQWIQTQSRHQFMSKAQYWILNVVGGICAVLLVGNVVLARMNEQTGRTLDENQAQVNRTQQVQTTAQNLIVRIAQAAQTEPALKELLVRHDLKVNLSENKPKASP
jgi:hypothetical protein